LCKTPVAEGSCDGFAKGGLAAWDRNPDLKHGDLSIAVLGHGAFPKKYNAILLAFARPGVGLRSRL